jgi:PAS domain S-box-containing protein
MTHDREVSSVDLKREAVFEAVFDASPDAILTVDGSGKIRLANHRAAELFGWTAAELRGHMVEALLPERARHAHVDLRRGYAAAPRTRPMGSGLTLVGRRRDGSEFPLEITLAPLDLDGAKLTIAIVRDVSDRRAAAVALARAHADLVRTSRELAAAYAELESFSYSVAHDLRAPLRAIDGFSALLAEELGPDAPDGCGRHVERIRAASKRMSEIIDALLSLARVSRVEMRTQDVDITAVAREIVARLRGDSTRAPTVEIAEGLRREGDPTLIRQLLENLIGNAWKFSARVGAPRIEVGYTDTDRGPAFFVRDNGAGFDMNAARQLFSPFHRLHSAAEFEGTGVGLTTALRIARRHGGDVWAEAAPGEGATFYFTLG